LLSNPHGASMADGSPQYNISIVQSSLEKDAYYARHHE
jgi:hypothetical protein